MRCILIIHIFVLLGACRHIDSLCFEREISSIILADENSHIFVRNKPNWEDEILKVHKEFVVESFVFNTHRFSPICGGCEEYRLLNFIGSKGFSYAFPINDEQLYLNQESGTLELYLNYIFLHEDTFKDFSFDKESHVYKLNTFLDVVIDSILFKQDLNKQRILLKNSNQLYERINRTKGLNSKGSKLEKSRSLIDSTEVMDSNRVIHKIIDNLNRNPKKSRYYFFNGAIYELLLEDKQGNLKVKINLLYKSLYSFIRI